MSQAFPEWQPPSPYKVNSIAELNPLVLGDIRAFLEQDPPRIPIKQVTGFTGFTAYSAYVNTDESTTSTTYTALATVGPLLDKLPPGQYVLWYGCACRTGTTSNSVMAPSINGATPANGTEAMVNTLAGGGTPAYPAVMGTPVTLTQDGGNTIEALYLTQGGGTTYFRNRWLIALRYA